MTSEEPECNSVEEAFIFPASFAQQRLWFLEQLVPGACLYNVPTVFRLTGRLNVAALEQSFNEIVRRHEILRTTFDTFEGQLVQVIAPKLKLSLLGVNLQELPASARETEALRIVWQDTQQPFNLSKGPLLQIKLLQLDQSQHILLINLHHIVFDEWSSGVLIKELGALYTAYSHGKPAVLPQLPIQYADFAHWQRSWLQGVLKQQLSYWQRQLKDVSILQLPCDRPRPSTQSYRGAIQLFELPQSLLEALEELSQQEGVSLFMTLLAAFQTLLNRYTGQTDIAVGSPIANRNRSELENLIGFFVNSLVFRTDLSGNPTFRELLGRVREVALGAYAHQDLPFEKLVEELQPERNLSHNPLFQVVFALQNTPMTQLELPGLTLSPINFETKTTRFDLEVYLWKHSENFRSLWGKGWEQAEGLRGVVVYNTDLFEPTTIARLRQHFQVLLEGIVANPNARVADLPILTAMERQVLIEFNNTQTDYPANKCIHQLFEAQVQQSPQAIALSFADRQFTYLELNSGSNQLAHYLRKLGVGADVLVGLCMERSAVAVAGMLGILKAGGAYVPLDPTHPPERLRELATQVSLVLTQQSGAESLAACPVKIICLEQEWSEIASESEENPVNLTTADNLAYVMYTSGSTGKPNAVAVPHRAVNRLVCNSNYIKLGASDKVACVANLAFDASTFEIWGALLNGAQLVGIPWDVALSPTLFATQIQQKAISVLFLTTALFNQIVSAVPDALSSLKYLLFGGETADPQRVLKLLQSPPQHLLHVYGPTENTTFSSYYEVKEWVDATTIPIGRAIANTQIYLLDADLNLVPIGVPGEIYLGGDGLARGYLNNPELTASRFILYPCMGDPAAPTTRLYKTGDLARYQPNGNLEFLGRLDDQIKLRGFRIELGEIETVLNQHPAIREAVVTVRSIEGDRSLVAHIVANQTLTQGELRDFLLSLLPDYMIPAAFVFLKALPLTRNGKIDRRALAVTTVLPHAIASEVPARTSVEATLVDIWSRLLGRSVGVYDNFFQVGGHSLLATQAISHIRTVLQVEVPLRQLFDTPTISRLAQYIDIQFAPDGRLENMKSQTRSEVEL